MGGTDDDTRGGTLRVLEFYSGLGGMASPSCIRFISVSKYSQCLVPVVPLEYSLGRQDMESISISCIWSA